MFRGNVRALFGTAVLAILTVGCSTNDPGITTKVKAKLAADDTVKSYRIDVDTKDAVVTLSGQVDSPVAKARAVELARATEGVREVVDNTTIVAGVTPPGGIDDAAATTGREAAAKADEKTDAAQRKAGDAPDTAGATVEDAALTAKVKTKFLADTKISGLKIDVDTKNNVVTLTGTVPTAAERTHAVSVAKGTDGVKSVVNKIKVGTDH
jgi:hyperosmotically inducible periplasmic protein